MTKTKAQTNKFEWKHPTTGDVFKYDNDQHRYELNDIELPGTTTPLTLVNELTWDKDGKMSDKASIIQKWALGRMADEIIENTKGKILNGEQIEPIVIEAKKAPNKRLKSAGISGTEIHDLIEGIIKIAISNTGFVKEDTYTNYPPQVQNFITWSIKNKVKFLYSEEPIYSKEWMNCGTVDFVCEIDGKVLVGDIKTNGDKRRYEWTGKGYDFSKPMSDIHVNSLFQTGAYAKMIVEPEARKLVEKVDGVVIVNIKKSGEFDESLDVRYDYNLQSLIDAYDHIIKLYKIYRNK